MTKIVRIPNETDILVCDSQKALILKNVGTPVRLSLDIQEHVEADESDRSAENSDRAGRRFDGGLAARSGGPRSAMETSDPARIRAEDFARKLADLLVRRHHSLGRKRLIVVAPPSFLGLLRQRFSSEIRQLVSFEVHKNLTEVPVSEIQKTLVECLQNSDEV